MRSGRKINNRSTFFFIHLPAAIALTFALSGCSVGYRLVHPPETRAPEEFPETEIVFDAGGGTFGFVNSDGTDATYLQLWAVSQDEEYSYGSLPVLGSSGDFLIFLETPTLPYHDIIPAGKIVIVRSGEFPLVCENWYSERPQIRGDSILALQGGSSFLGLFNLHNCTDSGDAIPLVIYDVPIWQNADDPPLVKRSPSISVIAPNGQLIAYRSPENEIIIRNLQNSNEFMVGEGDFISWSRDSLWLAFTGDDGIYVAQADGTEVRRIITSDHSGLYSTRWIGTAGPFSPPWASWSPDGKWLVYHMCGNAPYCDTESGIYKVDIETGEIIKIVDRGYYPSWRWSSEP
jgi:hypothetical protein